MKTKSNDRSQIFAVATSQSQMLVAMAIIILLWITGIIESQHVPELEIINGAACIFFLFSEVKIAYVLDCSKSFILILLLMPILNTYVQYLNSTIWVSTHYIELIKIIAIVNFTQLIYLNWLASRILKYSGIRIGLLGANRRDLDQYARLNRG